MAVATAAIGTVTHTDATQNQLLIFGTITAGASPLTYTTGGIALTITGLDVIKSSSVPIWAEAQSQPAAGTSASGYQYYITWGTTQSSLKLSIFTGAAAQSPLAELSNAASIPAAVSGDVIAFVMGFPKNV